MHLSYGVAKNWKRIKNLREMRKNQSGEIRRYYRTSTIFKKKRGISWFGWPFIHTVSVSERMRAYLGKNRRKCTNARLFGSMQVIVDARVRRACVSMMKDGPNRSFDAVETEVRSTRLLPRCGLVAFSCMPRLPIFMANPSHMCAYVWRAIDARI